MRLALLYGGVFIACGAALLALTYLLVAAQGSRSTSRLTGLRRGVAPGRSAASAVASSQHAEVLHTLVMMSAVAIAIMVPVSILLGWLIAGRVLRPLRTITAATRDISAASLHQRLVLTGPDDELKELADTIDALLARLEGSFQSQQRFVANASHELRTPLARLKTLLQVAAADPDATLASMRSAQERALASELQLEQLIDALLALASGEQAADDREPIDIATVTSATLRARAHEIERSALQVTAELHHAWTEGNPQLIERLVANLIDNAIGHNAPGGWIELTTTTRSGRAVLSVANSGPVIHPHDLERLKQPFQRLGTDRAHPKGHGLGLSIIASVTAAHGGTMELCPHPEGGLRAQIELPAAAKPALRPPAAPPSARKDPRGKRSTPSSAQTSSNATHTLPRFEDLL